MSDLTDLTSTRIIKTVDPLGVVRHYHGLSIARAVTEASMEFFLNAKPEVMQSELRANGNFAINTIDELKNERLIYVKPRIELELKLRLPGSNE